MFTIGMIMAMTPMNDTAESMVRSMAVDLFTMNMPNPIIMTTEPNSITGFGPILGITLPTIGPTTIMAMAAGARVRPVEMVSSPRP